MRKTKPKPMAPRHLLEELLARQRMLIAQHNNELTGVSFTKDLKA